MQYRRRTSRCRWHWNHSCYCRCCWLAMHEARVQSLVGARWIAWSAIPPIGKLLGIDDRSAKTISTVILHAIEIYSKLLWQPTCRNVRMVRLSKHVCEVIRSINLLMVAARITAISALLSVLGGSKRMLVEASGFEKLWCKERQVHFISISTCGCVKARLWISPVLIWIREN